jgi:hypothetical protein
MVKNHTCLKISKLNLNSILIEKCIINNKFDKNILFKDPSFNSEETKYLNLQYK